MADFQTNYLINVTLGQLDALKSLRDQLKEIREYAKGGADFKMRLESQSLGVMKKEIAKAVRAGIREGTSDRASKTDVEMAIEEVYKERKSRRRKREAEPEERPARKGPASKKDTKPTVVQVAPSAAEVNRAKARDTAMNKNLTALSTAMANNTAAIAALTARMDAIPPGGGTGGGTPPIVRRPAAEAVQPISRTSTATSQTKAISSAADSRRASIEQRIKETEDRLAREEKRLATIRALSIQEEARAEVERTKEVKKRVNNKARGREDVEYGHEGKTENVPKIKVVKKGAVIQNDLDNLSAAIRQSIDFVSGPKTKAKLLSKFEDINQRYQKSKETPGSRSGIDARKDMIVMAADMEKKMGSVRNRTENIIRNEKIALSRLRNDADELRKEREADAAAAWNKQVGYGPSYGGRDGSYLRKSSGGEHEMTLDLSRFEADMMGVADKFAQRMLGVLGGAVTPPLGTRPPDIDRTTVPFEGDLKGTRPFAQYSVGRQAEMVAGLKVLERNLMKARSSGANKGDIESMMGLIDEQTRKLEAGGIEYTPNTPNQNIHKGIYMSNAELEQFKKDPKFVPKAAAKLDRFNPEDPFHKIAGAANDMLESLGKLERIDLTNLTNAFDKIAGAVANISQLMQKLNVPMTAAIAEEIKRNSGAGGVDARQKKADADRERLRKARRRLPGWLDRELVALEQEKTQKEEQKLMQQLEAEEERARIEREYGPERDSWTRRYRKANQKKKGKMMESAHADALAMDPTVVTKASIQKSWPRHAVEDEAWEEERRRVLQAGAEAERREAIRKEMDKRLKEREKADKLQQRFDDEDARDLSDAEKRKRRLQRKKDESDFRHLQKSLAAQEKKDKAAIAAAEKWQKDEHFGYVEKNRREAEEAVARERQARAQDIMNQARLRNPGLDESARPRLLKRLMTGYQRLGTNQNRVEELTALAETRRAMGLDVNYQQIIDANAKVAARSDMLGKDADFAARLMPNEFGEVARHRRAQRAAEARAARLGAAADDVGRGIALDPATERRLVKWGAEADGSTAAKRLFTEESIAKAQQRQTAEMEKHRKLAISTLGQRLEQLKATQKETAHMSALGQKFRQLLMYVAAGGVIYGTLATLRRGLTSAMDLERDMAGIQGIFLNKTTTERDAIRSGVGTAAYEYGVPLSQVTQTARTFAQTGASPAKTLQMTRAAMTATVGAGMDGQQATEMMIAVDNITGGRVTAANIIDRISRMEAQYAVTAQDLSVAIQRVGSLAVQMQPSALGTVDALDTIIAASTAIIERTRVSGSQAATSLRFMLSRLSAPDVARQLQDKHGILLSETADGSKMRPLQDIMGDIAAKYQEYSTPDANGKVDTVRAASLLTTFAGARQVNQAAALFQDWPKVMETARESSLAFGDAQRRLEIQLDTLSARVERTNNAFIGFIAALLEKTPAMKVLKAITSGTGSLLAGASTSGGLSTMLTGGVVSAVGLGSAWVGGGLGTAGAVGLGASVGGIGAFLATTIGPVIAGLGALLLLWERFTKEERERQKRQDEFGAANVTLAALQKTPEFKDYQERANKFGQTPDTMYGIAVDATRYAKQYVLDNPQLFPEGEALWATDPSERKYNRSFGRTIEAKILEYMDEALPGFKDAGDEAYRLADALTILKGSIIQGGGAAFVETSRLREHVLREGQTLSERMAGMSFQASAIPATGALRMIGQMDSRLIVPQTSGYPAVVPETRNDYSKVRPGDIGFRYNAELAKRLGSTDLSAQRGDALRIMDFLTGGLGSSLNAPGMRMLKGGGRGSGILDQALQNLQGGGTLGQALDTVVLDDYVNLGTDSKEERARKAANRKLFSESLYVDMRARFSQADREAGATLAKSTDPAAGGGAFAKFFVDQFVDNLPRLIKDIEEKMPETARELGAFAESVGDDKSRQRHAAAIADNMRGRGRTYTRDRMLDVVLGYRGAMSEIGTTSAAFGAAGIGYNADEERRSATRSALQGVISAQEAITNDLIKAYNGIASLDSRKASLGSAIQNLQTAETVEGREIVNAELKRAALAAEEGMSENQRKQFQEQIRVLEEARTEIANNEPLFKELTDVLPKALRQELESAFSNRDFSKLTVNDLRQFFTAAAKVQEQTALRKGLERDAIGYEGTRLSSAARFAATQEDLRLGSLVQRAEIARDPRAAMDARIASIRARQAAVEEQAMISGQTAIQAASAERADIGEVEYTRRITAAKEAYKQAIVDGNNEAAVNLQQLLDQAENTILQQRAQTYESMAQNAVSGLREVLLDQEKLLNAPLQTIVPAIGDTIRTAIVDSFLSVSFGPEGLFGDALKSLFDKDMYMDNAVINAASVVLNMRDTLGGGGGGAESSPFAAGDFDPSGLTKEQKEARVRQLMSSPDMQRNMRLSGAAGVSVSGRLGDMTMGKLAHGVYNPLTDNITLFDGAFAEGQNTGDILTHELGHNLASENKGLYERFLAAKGGRRAPHPHDYYNKSDREAFAESFVAATSMINESAANPNLSTRHLQRTISTWETERPGTRTLLAELLSSPDLSRNALQALRPWLQAETESPITELIEHAERTRARQAQFEANGIPDFQRLAYQPRVSEVLQASIRPQGYEGAEERIEFAKKVFFSGVTPKDPIRENKDRWMARREDAWRLYLGIPQRNNTFAMSAYRPSRGKEDTPYFKINNFLRVENNAPDPFRLVDPRQTAQNIKYYVEELDSRRKWGGRGLMTDVHAGVMGNYTLGKGRDEEGHYLSYYDKWDLAVPGADKVGKPFEIYDRIYYDPKTYMPMPEKHVTPLESAPYTTGFNPFALPKAPRDPFNGRVDLQQLVAGGFDPFSLPAGLAVGAGGGVDALASLQAGFNPFTIPPGLFDKLKFWQNQQAMAQLKQAGAGMLGSVGGGMIGSALGVNRGKNYGADGAAIGTGIGGLFGPAGAVVGGMLGGFVGGRFGKKGEKQTPEYQALERIDRNTRETVTAIESQGRMAGLESRFLGLPAGFVVPSYTPMAFGAGGAAPGQSAAAGVQGASVQVHGGITIHVNAANDPEATARAVAEALRRELGSAGSFGSSFN